MRKIALTAVSAALAVFAFGASSYPTFRQMERLIGAAKEAGGNAGAYDAACTNRSQSVYSSPTFGQMERLIREVRSITNSPGHAVDAPVRSVNGKTGDVVVVEAPAGCATSNDAFTITKSMLPRKISAYLWSVGTEGENWDMATNRLAKVYPSWGGGCTGVKAGRFHGRNLDWYYNKGCTVIVTSPSSEGKYGSIGVADGLDPLTEDVMEKQRWTTAYYTVPFCWTDGMNEKGVVVQSNVIPTNMTKSAAWHTKRPGCVLAFCIIRHVLDRCATAYEAAQMIRDKLFVPSEFHYDSHYLVSDLNSSYIVEDGQILSGVPCDVLANFRLAGVSYDIDNKPDWDTVEPFGQGVERYEWIRDNGLDKTTIEGITATMLGLNYTKAYLPTTSPFWYTEYCEDSDPNLTVQNAKSNPSVFDAAVSNQCAVFADEHNASSANYRGGKSWQTVHTSIFDQQDLSLRVYVQETSKCYYFKMSPTQDPYVKSASLATDGETLYITNSAGVGISFRGGGAGGYDKRDLTNNVCFATTSGAPYGLWSRENLPSGATWDDQPAYDAGMDLWGWDYTSPEGSGTALSEEGGENATSLTFGYGEGFTSTRTSTVIAISNDTFTTYAFVTSAIAASADYTTNNEVLVRSITNTVDAAVLARVTGQVTSEVDDALKDILGDDWKTTYGGGLAAILAGILAAIAWLRTNKLSKGLSASGVPVDSGMSELLSSNNTQFVATVTAIVNDIISGETKYDPGTETISVSQATASYADDTISSSNWSYDDASETIVLK